MMRPATISQVRVPQIRRMLSTSPNSKLSLTSEPTTAHFSLPNARPEHVSERFDRLIGSNRLLRCIFYGVQDVSRATAAVGNAVHSVTETTKAVVAEGVRDVNKAKTAIGNAAHTVKETTKAVVGEVQPIRFASTAHPETKSQVYQKFAGHSRILQSMLYSGEKATGTRPAATRTARPKAAAPVSPPTEPQAMHATPTLFAAAAAGVRPHRSLRHRGIFKDLDIATARMAVGCTSTSHNDVPTWY